MEGVNNFAVNQASIHTSPGCTLPSNQLASTSQLTEGWFVNTDCASAHTNNEVRDAAQLPRNVSREGLTEFCR